MSTSLIRRAAAFTGLTAMALMTVAKADAQTPVPPKPAPPAEKAKTPANGKEGMVFNKVEGETVVLTRRPQGSWVMKGEVVCELDASAFKDQLTNQEIAVASATAAHRNAQLTREVAELAVKEYALGVFQQELEVFKGELALASSDRRRAERRLESTKSMVDKGVLAKGHLDTARVSLEKARGKEQQAQTKLDVLEKFTKDKKVKALQGEVMKAKADELAKEANHGAEQLKRDTLRKRIGFCSVVAPITGKVVYDTPIEEGDKVAQGRLLFRVIPDETVKPLPNAKAK